MSSKESSFVVIICHGSYHTPEPYQPFIIALRAQGIEAYCPQLPSSDLLKLDIGDPSNPDYSRAPPPNGHPQPSDDAVIITELLHQLVTESGKQVLLIGHSSGAFTATMVAVPELHAKTRKASGAPGGIVGIFYECGFLIPPGESVHRFFQPKDGSDAIIPPYCHFHVRPPKTSILREPLSPPLSSVSTFHTSAETLAGPTDRLPETRFPRPRLRDFGRYILLQRPRSRRRQILRSDLDRISGLHDCAD